MPRRRSKANPVARRNLAKKTKTVAVIGTGLIGASIGLAARGAGFDVIGWDRNATTLRAARKRGAVRKIATSLSDAVAHAAIVILAAPLDVVIRQLPEVFESSRSGALVIDVASVKERVAMRAATMLARMRDIQFVAGHPIAGSERSGPGAADAKLLKGRAFVLHAPPQHMRKQAYTAAARFVRKIGAVPIAIDPRDHDLAVAALSALPQLTSVALALAVSESGAGSARRLAGPGYRDATRLAQSRFAMWKPVLEANVKNVLKSIRALGKRVEVIERALRRRDWNVLQRLFSAAAMARRRVNPR
jgi:prephenate dehydrogenase